MGPKRSTPALSITTTRYWLERLGNHVRRTRGVAYRDADYSVQISHEGQRRRIKLGTPEKQLAASRACKFYKALITGGWEAAYKECKFATAPKPRTKPIKRSSLPGQNLTVFAPNTLGSVIEAYRKVASARETSQRSNIGKLRKIYADIHQIPKGGKYAVRSGGYAAWCARVDALYLDSITDSEVMAWKNNYIQIGQDAERQRARTTTALSVIRGARAVFGRKHRSLLRNMAEFPEPLPFDGIPLEQSPIRRYKSRIDGLALLVGARRELRPTDGAAYLIFCLALRCGLRRKEIDTLLWSSVDLDARVLNVEPNAYYDLKSRDSDAPVDLPEDFIRELQEFRNVADSEFVVPSSRPPRPFRSSGDYRCSPIFKDLLDWLRSKGVSSSKPLHELRKEAGSLVSAEYGVHEASRFLRHADIRVTASYYLDTKTRVVVAFGQEPKEQKNGAGAEAKQLQQELQAALREPLPPLGFKKRSRPEPRRARVPPAPMITLSRGQIHRNVWKNPAYKVAAKYGISGSLLARICTHLDIPRPGRGYWALTEGERKQYKKPLPDARDGMPDTWPVSEARVAGQG
jgi:integrase